jgi:hypothetical protein
MTRHLTCLALTPSAFLLLNSDPDNDIVRAFGIFHKIPYLMLSDVEKLIDYLNATSMVDNFIAAAQGAS